jgi:hypothetical protein
MRYARSIHAFPPECDRATSGEFSTLEWLLDSKSPGSLPCPWETSHIGRAHGNNLTEAFVSLLYMLFKSRKRG